MDLKKKYILVTYQNSDSLSKLYIKEVTRADISDIYEIDFKAKYKENYN